MHRTRASFGGIPMIVVLLVLASLCATPGGAVLANVATPSPSGTPAGADPAGCDALPAYFGAANALTAANEGLVILKAASYDVLSLSGEQAVTVVASLDELLVEWDALVPPPAAEAWHKASRDLFAWYREMADPSNRSHLDHQRLINGDKTIVPALGRATVAGQSACGYERWNAALATAPSSTPAP